MASRIFCSIHWPKLASPSGLRVRHALALQLSLAAAGCTPFQVTSESGWQVRVELKKDNQTKMDEEHQQKLAPTQWISPEKGSITVQFFTEGDTNINKTSQHSHGA